MRDQYVLCKLLTQHSFSTRGRWVSIMDSMSGLDGWSLVGHLNCKWSQKAVVSLRRSSNCTDLSVRVRGLVLPEQLDHILLKIHTNQILLKGYPSVGSLICSWLIHVGRLARKVMIVDWSWPSVYRPYPCSWPTLFSVFVDNDSQKQKNRNIGKGLRALSMHINGINGRRRWETSDLAAAPICFVSHLTSVMWLILPGLPCFTALSLSLDLPCLLSNQITKV